MALAPDTAAYWWAYVHEIGAAKYGAYNWRATDVVASVYLDAAKRHLDLIAAGQWIDEETGAPHAAHVMACAAILIDAQQHGTLLEDCGLPVGALEAVWEIIAKLRAERGLTDKELLADRHDTKQQKKTPLEVSAE